jgi:hypothetical protein
MGQGGITLKQAVIMLEDFSIKCASESLVHVLSADTYIDNLSGKKMFIILYSKDELKFLFKEADLVEASKKYYCERDIAQKKLIQYETYKKII